MAFGHFADGRVSAVLGTHTHVPTADAQILPGGTAFISDVGMCGDYDSVIGMQKAPSVRRFVTKMPGEKPKVAEGEATLCGVFVDDRRYDRSGAPYRAGAGGRPPRAASAAAVSAPGRCRDVRSGIAPILPYWLVRPRRSEDC